jgi:hypothetical protein
MTMVAMILNKIDTQVLSKMHDGEIKTFTYKMIKLMKKQFFSVAQFREGKTTDLSNRFTNDQRAFASAQSTKV